ncbi:MAG: TIGR03915 family putative DNA repair protein [Fibrobacteraceae bacterium]|nr:TIGR03915 family putative DNA repair protein [Fibrobacteraceae bacterium]
MLSIIYDASFDGFLSSIFEIYRMRLQVGAFVPERLAPKDSSASGDLFLQPFRMETNVEYARRLERAIVNAASQEVLKILQTSFLSEVPGIEMKLLTYLKKLFEGSEPNFGRNLTSMEMLPILKIAQSVNREAGNMLGLVRFARVSSSTYVSEIEPKYNVLPLIINHFRVRFGLQQWVIYDSKRNYGAFHDGQNTKMVYLPNGVPKMENDNFTSLWKDYYKSMAIKERENPKLLRQCLPVRYWKHLPERQGA